MRIYSTGDLSQLACELDKAKDSRRRLIVTDSLFSMDGVAAPLAELFQMAEQTHSMLLIDEAHATGVYGAHGRGVCEEAGLDGLHCVRVGTLSKAIGTQGGFVAGPQPLCDWIRNTARPQMFSTALTPGACGAALESLRLICSEPDRRVRVRDLARQLRSELQAAGWSTTGDADCPIVPLMVGDPQAAVALSRELQQHGFLVPAIRPPTVPRGTSRLRISLTAEHTLDDLRRCVAVLAARRPGGR